RRGHMGSRRLVRAGSLHRDIRIAPSQRHPEVRRTPYVIVAAPAGQSENAAIVRLSLVFERQSSVGVGRAVDGLIPAPEVNAARNAANRLHVHCALGIDAVTGLQALDNKSQRARPRGYGSQLRKAQALIRTESVSSRTDVSGNRFRATACARLTWTSVFAGRVGIDSLSTDAAADVHGE